MQQIADANSIYGIERIQIAPSREELMVEFDASRLRTTEVETALQRAGIPVIAVFSGDVSPRRAVFAGRIKTAPAELFRPAGVNGE